MQKEAKTGRNTKTETKSQTNRQIYCIETDSYGYIPRQIILQKKTHKLIKKI